MNTSTNLNIFGTGSCEDILAISDETDRPCADTSAIDKNAGEIPLDNPQAVGTRKLIRFFAKRIHSGQKLRNKKPIKKGEAAAGPLCTYLDKKQLLRSQKD